MELNQEIDYCQKLSTEVKNTFSKISNALKSRELQLLRQLEVYSEHYKLIESYEIFKKISIVFDKEVDILNSISIFGRIDFDGLSPSSESCKIEDYQRPEDDHISLNKYLGNKSTESVLSINSPSIESENFQYSIDSNIESNAFAEIDVDILKCIEKQDPSLCLHHISHVSDSTNDSTSLDTQNASLKETDCDTRGSTHLINSSSVPNLSCKCDNMPGIKTEELTFVEKKVSDHVRKLSMKQPVQVQQWMKQIIAEPETEPNPNNVMEHSHIKVSRKESV